MQFTFTRRMSKPTASQLNSTTDFSDPTNYDVGNPDLIPESVTDFELDSTKSLHSINFTSGIYIYTIKNVIKYMQVMAVNNKSTTMPPLRSLQIGFI